MLWTLVGPQTSIWNKLNGTKLFLLLKGKDTRWCLAYSQTSQWKFWTFSFSNILGNIFFNNKKGGWTRRKWDNQTCSSAGVWCFDKYVWGVGHVVPLSTSRKNSPPSSLACLITFLVRRSWKEHSDCVKLTEQFRSLVVWGITNLLIVLEHVRHFLMSEKMLRRHFLNQPRLLRYHQQFWSFDFPGMECN